jgi:hypothetical protein
MKELPKAGTFFGDVAEDIMDAVVHDVLHELRPDVLFANDFPEMIKSLDNMSPNAVIRGLIKDFMNTGKK